MRIGPTLQNYLGLKESDNVGYFAAIAEIMSMPVAVRRDVAALERPALPAEFLLRHIDKVEAVLPFMGQPSQGVKVITDGVGNEVVESLEACSHILAQSRAEAVVPPKTLKDIRNLATEIIDDLESDDGLSREFREEIRRHAQSIIDAANMYMVHGADGLLDEADALVGVYVRHLDESREREQSSPVLRKLRKLLAEILVVVAVTTAPHEISASMAAYSQVLELPASIQAPGEIIEDADVVERDDSA